MYKESRPRLRANAQGKLGREAIIDRDHLHAAGDASPERDNPLRPVLAPNQAAIAFATARRIQVCGESADCIEGFAVRKPPRTKAIEPQQRLAAPKTFERSDQIQKSVHVLLFVR